MNYDFHIGDTVMWKGGGFLRGILVPVLRIFEPHWDGWGWHLGKVVEIKSPSEIMILEAVWPRVRISDLRTLSYNYKVYRVFNKKLNAKKVAQFAAERAGHLNSDGSWELGCKYDAWVYVFTIIQHISTRVFHRVLPRIVDGAYSCWELAAEFDDHFGRPWPKTHDIQHQYPLITDFVKMMDGDNAIP
jgi:hypothetical protein